jgi:hypothetical protein
MTAVFLVQHVRGSQDDEDVKIIGVFSSKKEADKAIEKAKLLPGFSEEPDGFCIDRYVLNTSYWQEGF